MTVGEFRGENRLGEHESTSQAESLKLELTSLESSVGEESPELVMPLERVAYSLHAIGKYAEAESYYERSLGLRERHFPQDRQGIICSLHSLGILKRLQSQFAESEPYYTRALEETREHFPGDELEIATRQNYLAALYFAWGKFEQSRELVDASRQIYSRVDQRSILYAVATMAMVLICHRLGRDIKDCLRQVEEYAGRVRQGSLVADFNHLQESLLLLALRKYKAQEFEEAETLFRYSLLSETGDLWPDHPIVADNVQLLADLYKSQQMQPEAEFLFRKALEMRLAVLGPEHLDVAVSAYGLGSLLIELRRFEEAETLLAQSVKIRERGGFPPMLAKSLQAHAVALERTGRNNEAREARERMDKILEDYRPKQMS